MIEEELWGLHQVLRCFVLDELVLPRPCLLLVTQGLHQAMQGVALIDQFALLAVLVLLIRVDQGIAFVVRR